MSKRGIHCVVCARMHTGTWSSLPLQAPLWDSISNRYICAAKKKIYIYIYIHTHTQIWFVIQRDSFGTRPKKMRISQRLFIRFWTRIYDYIPCFMRSMSILLCRSLTGWLRQTSFLSSKERGTLGKDGEKSWRHRDNDRSLAPCRALSCRVER
jgi:hypothetical protein